MRKNPDGERRKLLEPAGSPSKGPKDLADRSINPRGFLRRAG